MVSSWVTVNGVVVPDDAYAVTGAQSVGLTDHVGMLRGLIQTGFHLGAWKDKLMVSPERVSEAYLAVAHGSASHGPVGPHVNAPIVKAA